MIPPRPQPARLGKEAPRHESVLPLRSELRPPRGAACPVPLPIGNHLSGINLKHKALVAQQVARPES